MLRSWANPRGSKIDWTLFWSKGFGCRKSCNFLGYVLEYYIFRVPVVKQDLFDKINLFIKKILLDNGYPEDIVLKHISKKITRFSTAKPFGPEKRPVYLRAPWIGSASQQLKHQVKSAVQNCYEAVSPHLIFSSQCMLPAAKKDVLPTNQRSTVIYEYVCHVDSQYIPVGRTTQKLQERIKQHVPKAIRHKTTLTQEQGTHRSQPNRNCKAKSKTQFEPESDSAIGQHLLESNQCACNYSNSQFKIPTSGRVYILALRSVLLQRNTSTLALMRFTFSGCITFVVVGYQLSQFSEKSLNQWITNGCLIFIHLYSCSPVADPQNFGGGMIKILSTKPQKFECVVTRRIARNLPRSSCFRGLGQSPNGQPFTDKIPNWTKSRSTKSRIGQNPEWTKSRIGQNPELDKIQNWTKSRMDKIPNRKNPERAKSRI